MNPFDPKAFSGQQKISALIALAAMVALVICLTLLGKRENQVMDDASKDLHEALRMINQAPSEGDFEIQYPALITQGELTVSRIDGVPSVSLPPLPVDKCNLVMNVARRQTFASAQVWTGDQSTQIDLDTADGRAIAAACSGGGTKMVRVSLTPKS